MRTIDKVLIALILSSLVGCASTPKEKQFFVDEYGIVHVDPPSVEQVTSVAVSYRALPAGCLRLRDIYVDNSSEWNLQYEAATMFATHVHKFAGLPRGIWGGVAYNCTNWQENASNLANQMKKSQAMAELESRRAAKGEEYQLRKVEPGAIKMGHKGQLPKYVEAK